MYEDDGIYHLLLKINHKNFAIGFAYLKEAGLHPGQMPLITGLYKKEGVTQKEIADKLGIKPSTINVMIRRLEKKKVCHQEAGSGRSEEEPRVSHGARPADL